MFYRLRIAKILFAFVMTVPLLFIPFAIIAAAPQSIGQGCTTMYYIDKDCDGYGVGKKSSGLYPLGSGMTFQPGTYTVGDMVDADDEDPKVNTTVSWQAKWGTTKESMVNFLQVRKGFINTGR